MITDAIDPSGRSCDGANGGRHAVSVYRHRPHLEVLFTQLTNKADTVTEWAFLEALVALVPYKIDIVLTDNGIPFADLPKQRSLNR